MHNSLVIKLCIIFIYSTRQTNCYDQHRNDDIDDFIKKLMTSEKFEELADVIAEKAARKIKNFHTKDVSHFKYGETNNDNSYRAILKKVTDDDKSKERHGFKIQTKSARYKLAHIDPKVFIQKDSYHPHEKLSLNFNNLMKKSLNNRHINEWDSKKKLNGNGDGTYRNNNNKAVVNNENNKNFFDEGIKKSHSDHSPEIKNHEFDEEVEIKVTKNFIITTNKPSNNGLDDGLSTNERTDSKNSDEAPPINQNQIEKEHSVNENLRPVVEINEKKIEDMNEDYLNDTPRSFRSNTEKSHSERRNSYTVSKNIYHRDLPVAPVVIPNEMKLYSEFQVNTKEMANKIKKQIRQEAGGQFMYTPSHDYDEYYEKLATSKSPNIESFLT